MHITDLTDFKASWATTLDNSTQNSRLQVPKVAIAVWLHISCRLQAMATLGVMYPARGGLV